MNTQCYFTNTLGVKGNQEREKALLQTYLHSPGLSQNPCCSSHPGKQIATGKENTQGQAPPQVPPSITGAATPHGGHQTCPAPLATPAELLPSVGDCRSCPVTQDSLSPRASILLNAVAPGQKGTEAPTPTPSPFLLRGSEVLPPPPPPLPNSLHKAPPRNTQKVCV